MTSTENLVGKLFLKFQNDFFSEFLLNQSEHAEISQGITWKLKGIWNCSLCSKPLKCFVIPA